MRGLEDGAYYALHLPTYEAWTTKWALKLMYADRPPQSGGLSKKLPSSSDAAAHHRRLDACAAMGVYSCHADKRSA